MKTIKLLWQRFWSKTPVLLARFRNFCLFIAGLTGVIIPILNTSPATEKYGIWLGGIAAVFGAMAAGIQFATSDPVLAEKK